MRRRPPAEGPRHGPDWYDQRHEPVVLREGDRLFIPCDGGPSGSRAETYPPRLEIADQGGMYVLADEGPRSAWRYVFVPTEAP